MLTPRVLRLLFAITLVLQVVVLFITYRMQARMKEESTAIRNANTTLRELEGIVSALKDADAGYRGYLLTNDTLFLGTYQASEPQAMATVAAVRAMAETREQRVRAESLERLVTRQYNLMRSVLSNDSVPLTERIAEVRAELLDSRVNMEALARLVETISAEERLLMSGSEEEERSLGMLTPRILLLYGLLAIGATSLLFVRLMLEMRKVEKARETVRVQVQQLETEAVERERAERSLKRVLDSSVSGIMAFRALRNDKGSIEDFEWTLVNHRAEEILGRKAEALLGKRLLQEIPANLDNGSFARYRQVVETGEPLRTEEHHRSANGDLWLDAIAVRLMDGFVVTFTDVSATKTQQELGQEKDRLALTGKIARTVAHEVRNPLTNVKLALEQLREEPLPEEGDAALYLDIIQRNADRISGLITEMLESSKPRMLTLGPCQPHVLLNDVADLVRDRIGLQRMQLHVEAATDLPAIGIDRAQARLALLNISVNAIEAMEPGKGVLHLSADRDGGAVIIRIADNGKGIPKDRIGELFEPFVTGHDGGMGLGLTTARSILNSHAVHMGVESEEGVGTTFVLRFPVMAVAD